ncbi:alpha-hydroxy acid oxidase [Streptomyces sp. CA-106131]|uniref:alpha-hydroxy acid oxidase n=1 Tax=Streptomyces sp. CA-106131 TaxID=3240045 RepID=UPI003D93ACB1
MSGFHYRLRAPGEPLTVADWRRRARRRLPRMVWAYVEHGADGERTLRENESAFAGRRLNQRVLTRTSAVDLGVTVAGTPLALPILLAPTGLAGAVHWHGDLGAAQAAEEAGTRLVLSSASAYSIEEMALSTRADHFFQLYPWRDRALTASLISRARDCGYRALVVTVDVPVYGNRLRERRTGMTLPPTLTPLRVLDAARHPRWCYGYFRHRRTTLRNLVPDGRSIPAADSVHIQSSNLTANMGWADLEWIRTRWHGPLYVKGILHPDDAERAVETGADGVIVSNHGGRQLDAVPASIHALPAVAERVGDRCEVLVDGGIRTGTDIAVALALGARACLIGRPLLYGLAAAGSHGVAAVLRILREELTRTLTLMGLPDVGDLDRSCLAEPEQTAASGLPRRPGQEGKAHRPTYTPADVTVWKPPPPSK